jgi:hypothetical protein
VRKLRSGKTISINTLYLSNLKNVTVQKATFSKYKKRSQHCNLKPILKHTVLPNPTPYADYDQNFENGIWNFQTSFTDETLESLKTNYKKRYKSSFSSPMKGTLDIKLCYDNVNDKRKIKFGFITVYFY